jgi:hypothetical protein
LSFVKVKDFLKSSKIPSPTSTICDAYQATPSYPSR